MKETYCIPAGPTARYDFQRNAVVLGTVNATAWGIPAAKVTNLATLRSAYELKYAVANNRSTQSPTATAARDAAWDALALALVDLYDHNLVNNAAIVPADKLALNIHGTARVAVVVTRRLLLKPLPS